MLAAICRPMRAIDSNICARASALPREAFTARHSTCKAKAR
jgi:hypothetical protein